MGDIMCVFALGLCLLGRRRTLREATGLWVLAARLQGEEIFVVVVAVLRLAQTTRSWRRLKGEQLCVITESHFAARDTRRPEPGRVGDIEPWDSELLSGGFRGDRLEIAAVHHVLHRDELRCIL